MLSMNYTYWFQPTYTTIISANDVEEADKMFYDMLDKIKSTSGIIEHHCSVELTNEDEDDN